MLEYEQSKTLIRHLNRAGGHLISIGTMIDERRPIFEIDQQLHAATSSAISCYNSTFRTIIAARVSQAIAFRLRLPNISQREYDYWWNERRRLHTLSVRDILSHLDWLQQPLSKGEGRR